MTNDARRTGLAALVAGSLAGLVLGIGGIASAQEATPTPAPSSSTATPAPETDADTDAQTRDELCDEEDGAAGTDDSATDTATEPAADAV